jgi:hypothetical protein
MSALGPGLAALAVSVARHFAETVDALGALAHAMRAAGPAVGFASVVAGMVLLSIVGRVPRVLAGAGGALVGVLAALAAQGAIAFNLALSPSVAVPVAAVVVGGACAAFPPLYPVAVGALPGALLGVHVPLSGRAAFGAAAGALAGGLVALVFARAVSLLFASLAGGLCVALGAVAVLSKHPLAAELAARPFALLAVALVLGVAGTAFQLAQVEPVPRERLAPKQG